jgi:dynein heavy chain
MRKSVFTTPKSYLSFLAMYKDLYKKKYDEIDIQQSSIKSGLDKLLEATVGVGEMKKMLQIEDQKLRIASDETNKLIATLTIENEAAEKKTIECEATKAGVITQKENITVEKEAADRDLAAAMPFVEAAEKALSGIKPNDITELKAMKKLHDVGKIILDAV